MFVLIILYSLYLEYDSPLLPGGGALWARVFVHDVVLALCFLTFFDKSGGDEGISGGGR